MYICCLVFRQFNVDITAANGCTYIANIITKDDS